MRKLFFLFLFIAANSVIAFSQSTSQNDFWKKVSVHCGKSFEGKISSPGKNEGFDGKKLVMHVKSCEGNVLKIPFMSFVFSYYFWFKFYKYRILTYAHHL